MNSEETSTATSRSLCIFFVRNGNCRNGDECRWSHDLRGMTRAEALLTIPCPYFAKGKCRFGDRCELRHGDFDSPVTASIIDDSTENLSENRAEQTDCGICLDNVLSVKRQFGILSCCNHVFCHPCIKEWRNEGSKEMACRRLCPTCRKESDFVLASPVHPSNDEERHLILKKYKDRLATIPCNKFDGNMGSCNFGSDCFYAHFDTEGNNVKVQDKSRQQLYEEKQLEYRRCRLAGILFYEDSDIDSSEENISAYGSYFDQEPEYIIDLDSLDSVDRNVDWYDYELY